MITKEMQEVLEDLNSKFKYTLDPATKDTWSLMKQSDVMKGDCEDYSIYVLHTLSKGWFGFWKNLIFHKAKLFYVISNGVGHCVLEYDGHYTDNQVKRWVTREYMESRYEFKMRYWTPVVIAKFLLSA